MARKYKYCQNQTTSHVVSILTTERRCDCTSDGNLVSKERSYGFPQMVSLRKQNENQHEVKQRELPQFTLRPVLIILCGKTTSYRVRAYQLPNQAVGYVAIDHAIWP